MYPHQFRDAVMHLATLEAPLRDRVEFALDYVMGFAGADSLAPEARKVYDSVASQVIAVDAPNEKIKHLVGKLTTAELSELASQIVRLNELANAPA